MERDFDAGPSAMSWASASAEPEVGVGPHPQPFPDDPRLDPELLRDGDRRNVVDAYRYWSRAAIVADLDTRRHPFHVAIENWAHDLNIGTIVRCANAFLAAEVHIVGRRRWNRRGAMAMAFVGYNDGSGRTTLEERPLPAAVEGPRRNTAEHRHAGAALP